MIPSVFLSRAILALGLSSLVSADVNDIAACRWYVTAKTGDTCNSLAKEWGITYAIFIHNNPTVTSCYLTAGKTYCVDDRDALLTTKTTVTTSTSKPTPTTSIVPTISTTSTRSSTAATPTPSVSGFTQDGRCGPQGGFQTCIGSEDGDCCSPSGWCGGTDEHCGVGCILGYGLCTVGSSSASTTLASTTLTSVPSSSSPISTTTSPSPTSTLIQTTITVQVTAVFSIINTVTSVISQTTNITLTQTAFATSTNVVISTFNSLVFHTTTATVTVSRTSACPAVTCSCPFVSCPTLASPTIPSTPFATSRSSTATSVAGDPPWLYTVTGKLQLFGGR
jgi:hypothetical protein